MIQEAFLRNWRLSISVLHQDGSGMSVISDYGTQFYANKRDKNGKADHAFEIFLKERGISQILCGVNHPQTNGKQEKFHDFYKNHRGRFDSLDKMVTWYNN